MTDTKTHFLTTGAFSRASHLSRGALRLDDELG